MNLGRWAALALAVMLAPLLIACDGGGDDSADEAATATDSGTPGVTATASDATAPPATTRAPVTPSATDAAIPTGADDAVRAAKQDIVTNIFEDRTVEEIALISIEAASWPDACLGVPEEGEACAQVVTPGYEIVLDLEGAHYTYHTDQATNVRLANFDLDPSS
ncbi:MAG: hypothetical protein WEE64_04775 [Dehalococcoidia bacterium]